MKWHNKDTASMILCLLGNLALINAELESNETIVIPSILAGLAIVAWVLPPLNISRRLINTVASIGFGLFLVEYAMRSELQMLALAHFLIFIQGLFFLKALGLLERYILITTSLIQFLAASILTEEIIFILFFFGYIVLSTPILLQLGWSRTGSPDDALKRSLLFKSGVLVIIPLIPLIVILFLITPRFSFGMLADLNLLEYSQTGFSNEIRLGSMRMILEDATEVMRIEGPIMELPYLRGKAYDTYANLQWIQSTRKLFELNPDETNRFKLRTRKAPWQQQSEIQHKLIFTGEFEHSILPIPPLSAYVTYPALTIAQDSMDSVYLSAYPGYLTTCTTYSYPAQPLWKAVAESRDENYSDADQALYCSLDTTLRRDLRRLAQSLTLEQTTTLDKVQSIKEYLTTNYTYSLEHIVPRTMDPIIHFLFYEKYGHCEYFASAMTLLLRSIDIPARLVSGFIVREFTPDQTGYVIRQKDAHTWVEVLFPDVGWVTFDPTPTDVRYEGESWRVKWLRFNRTTKAKFRLFIIEYSQQHQLTVIKTAITATKDQFISAKKSAFYLSQLILKRLKAVSGFVMIVAVFLVVSGIIGGAVAITFSRINQALIERKRFSPQVRKVRKVYIRSMNQLGKLGWPWHKAATPDEVVSAMRSKNPTLADATNSLTTAYQAIRFGGQVPDLRLIEKLAQELRTQARRKVE